MADGAIAFSPGDLVRARGREWIVLPGASAAALKLRPLTGSEEDVQTIAPALELEPVESASFAPPDGSNFGPSEAALLLKDALRLSLRRGAGPFRGMGRIGFDPRAYQLVPLLMALKLEVVRLLIADDVGIGKTIEAGLILRELYDRGEIPGATVLCPPHLVEQWVEELESKFAISAAAVTGASAGRLERDLPSGESVFQAWPFTVVSLDFIKSPRRREEFLARAQDFVIVDEAHACVARNDSRHRRFELLRDLAANPERHLVMLTATPHSGDEQGYANLLSLIHPDFGDLAQAAPDERRRLRERLAAHFVQRRRVDIDAWKGQQGTFPKHERAEAPYRLTGAHEALLFDVLDYCAQVVERQGEERRRRLAFWGTLALMRCVASSPAAALSALRARAMLEAPDDDAEAIADAVFDSEADDRPDDDAEPAADIGDPALQGLIARAAFLAGAPESDPKLKALSGDLARLLDQGFNPVVFCRYIATAKMVALALARRFKAYEVACVTGELAPEDRRSAVEALSECEKRVLVATDCLSEGVNLQASFNAVVHYDLCWNPTRHQQREGRVDRFGQAADEVRSILMWGANNPVDGAVLQVILRKAETIRRETGVMMPMPADGRSLTEALMKAVLLRRAETRQATFFDVGLMTEAGEFDRAWTDAAESEKRSRTVFAQNTLRPEDVLPEWSATAAALGGEQETQRFVTRALRRLGAPLERRGRAFAAPLGAVDAAVRERLAAEDLARTVTVSFDQNPGRALYITRAHPLTAILAETLFERALAEEDGTDPATLPRAGVWTTAGVTKLTTVALVRIRHRLTSRSRGRIHSLLVEEAGAIAWQGADRPKVIASAGEALSLLDQASIDTPPEGVIRRHLESALRRLDERRDDLNSLANARAAALAADHDRVRTAARAAGASEVSAVTPVDVIGLYVLLPAGA